MIRSMTGFGGAEEVTAAGVVRVEIKTVNHRFLNVNMRTPTGFDGFESDIQSWLRPFLSRGHVTYTLSIDRDTAEANDTLPELDLERAKRYGELLETLRRELDLEAPVDLSHVSRFGEIFRAPERGNASALVEGEVIHRLTEAAATAVVLLREAEGARLHRDLEERLQAIEEALVRVEANAPERLVAERDRLRTAVAELIETHSVDEDRLAREIAYLAEKWDINEEIVRFRSHVELFNEALQTEASEPVGKRLGFLVQEMNREANTIGSKANDAQIAHAAVSLKEEVERLREQLENVE
jgi:uncharacterized protein (TIGR00255 family)